MRVRAITLLMASVALLVPVGSVSAGTPAPGWTRPALAHAFDHHDREGSDITTFNGRAYMAVSGREEGVKRLYLVTNDTATGAFARERVAEVPASDVIRTASIAVTPNGDVYIAYDIDPNFGPPTVHLATNASGSWTSVAAPSSTGSAPIEEPQYPDIAAKSDGSVALVFQGEHQAPCTGTGDIFLATFANGSFSTPTNVTLNNVGPSNRCVGNTFPAIAASGTELHLAYRWVSDAGGGIQLHYRSGALTNVTDETIDATSATNPNYDVVQFGVDIATDAAGAPHVAWVTDDGDNTSSSARWATKTGSTWTSEIVQTVTAGPSIRLPSIAVKQSTPAVAYTVASSGGGGSFQAQAFYGTRTGADVWAVRNLNAGSTDNFEPKIAAGAGFFHAVMLEVSGPFGGPFAYVYTHEAPKPSVDFNLTGGKTFSGGEPVPMRGDIDPATVPERVVINTQRKKGARWVPVDRKAVRSNADGEWSFRHPALPAGRTYRARAEVGDTVDHRAGKNPWVRFEVRSRRNH